MWQLLPYYVPIRISSEQYFLRVSIADRIANRLVLGLVGSGKVINRKGHLSKFSRRGNMMRIFIGVGICHNFYTSLFTANSGQGQQGCNIDVSREEGYRLFCSPFKDRCNSVNRIQINIRSFKKLCAL